MNLHRKSKKAMEAETISKNWMSRKRKMNRGIFLVMPLFIFFLLIIFCCTGCPDPDPVHVPINDTTIVSISNVEINAQGDMVEITPVTSNIKINLTVTSCPEWITVETKEEIMYITASKNESTEPRTGSIHYDYSGSKNGSSPSTSSTSSGSAFIFVTQKGTGSN